MRIWRERCKETKKHDSDGQKWKVHLTVIYKVGDPLLLWHVAISLLRSRAWLAHF